MLLSDAPEHLLHLRGLADSYLDHVLIALRANDRAATFRNFLDPWWVFQRGGAFAHHRSDGGFTPHTFNNPCPWSHRDRLAQFDWLSSGAKQILGMGREAKIKDRKQHPEHLRLVVDHAVPFAVIAKELWRQPMAWERENLRDFLNANFRRGVLTLFEDRRLTHLGWRNAMPAGWEFGDDPFARYYAADITRGEMPGSSRGSISQSICGRPL